MKPVQFVQYLRPNGRTRRVEVDRPDDVANKANSLWDAGYRLEIEVLTTGEINVTISAGDDDIMGRIAPNGPRLMEAIDEIITEFQL